MRRFALPMLCVLLAGCTDEGIRTGLIGGRFATQDAAATFTTADVRAIVKRQVRGRTIICTEPLPDVARAFAQSGQLSAGGGNGAATGTLAASAASAQTVADLAGRSTALLGIRDGLYRACEAYANGIIGDDAYALVVSRYSQLMVTLFLGQDLASAETKAVPASIAIDAAPPAPTSPSQDSKKLTTKAAFDATAAAPTLLRVGFQTIAAHPPPASGPPASGKAKPTKRLTASSDKPAPAAGTTSVAGAIAKMQQTYLELDHTSNDALIVACIEENDPTRAALRPDAPGGPYERNRFLAPICDEISRSYASKIGARPN